VLAQADSYQWQSPVRGLNGAGYYRLLLTPDVRARAMSDGADLRIVDSAGNYVPYLLRSESPVSQEQNITILPVRSSADTNTEAIIIDNKDGLQLSDLVLTLRNKAQSTYAQLTGSDDERQWFDISSNIVLSPSAEMQADTFDQELSFPPVKYKKLRLTIRIDKSIPVNIIRVAVQKPILTTGHYTSIPSPVIIQKDSAKRSYVLLDYKENYTIDKLTLGLTGSRLYHRQVEIYSRDSSAWIYAGSGMLSSTGRNALRPDTRTKHLLIVINNEDNAPLQIQSADGVQLNSYLISYLDADRNYYLVFGNAKVQRPKYDLTYFEDSIKTNVLKEITCGPIGANTIIPNAEPAKKAAVVKGLDKWWIWPVLIVILGGLLYFTVKMSRDVSRKT
jgi:hypothetical protein